MSAATVSASAAVPLQLDNALYSVVPSSWFVQRGVERQLQGLLFDVAGEHGQARRLDLAVVQEKVESFCHAEPTEPCSVIVWPSDAAGMPLPTHSHKVPTLLSPFSGSQLYVLSGQHGVGDLMDIRAHWVAEDRGDLPRWLQVVKANVLSVETPAEVRRLAAGEEQYRQQNVARVRVSEFLQHLCSWMPAGPRVELVHRIVDAVAVAGYPRPEKVCSHLPASAGTPPIALPLHSKSF